MFWSSPKFPEQPYRFPTADDPLDPSSRVGRFLLSGISSEHFSVGEARLAMRTIETCRESGRLFILRVMGIPQPSVLNQGANQGEHSDSCGFKIGPVDGVCFRIGSCTKPWALPIGGVVPSNAAVALTAADMQVFLLLCLNFDGAVMTVQLERRRLVG